EQTDQAEKRALLAEAEVFADRALAIYPEYLSANQMKSGFVAERYLVHRDLDQLLREFEAIVRVRPQVEYIRQFMEYLHGRADAEKLIDWYYRMSYDVLIREKRLYPLAVTYLKIAEKLAPQDPRILFALGKGLFLGGDQVQGRQYLDRAFAINPGLRELE